ncbi:hypothetical protein ECP02994389_4866 [Escherichia coli P0299438.9]|nr:hypothetical protein ECP02994389_4866 [Escherichia coli P0299438.9]
MPEATLRVLSGLRGSRSDKAFTPHPTSTPDATLAASYQAYARQRNSLI